MSTTYKFLCPIFLSSSQSGSSFSLFVLLFILTKKNVYLPCSPIKKQFPGGTEDEIETDTGTQTLF